MSKKTLGSLGPLLPSPAAVATLGAGHGKPWSSDAPRPQLPTSLGQFPSGPQLPIRHEAVGAQHPLSFHCLLMEIISTLCQPQQACRGKAIEVRGGRQPTHHGRHGHSSRGDMQSPAEGHLWGSDSFKPRTSAKLQLCQIITWNTLKIAASVMNG